MYLVQIFIQILISLLIAGIFAIIGRYYTYIHTKKKKKKKPTPKHMINLLFERRYPIQPHYAVHTK